ncbi:hypothetical protein SAY86_009253 [Trapa natans]|uniref:Ribosome biogenesis protein NOP53 n=1 Tax=Trapa natans TaxID=22666 RepID=A0AAN7QSH8_TRANT|nr:hypothetical protein SAY86_009253 [Trapa natans]
MGKGAKSDDFLEKSTKDARTVSAGENDFGLDADLSVKRKIEKHRDKVIHYESVLQKNPFVQAVPSSIKKKSIKKLEALLKFQRNYSRLSQGLFHLRVFHC